MDVIKDFLIWKNLETTALYSLQNEGMASRVLTTKKKQIIDIFCEVCLHYYYSVDIQQKFCCGF